MQPRLIGQPYWDPNVPIQQHPALMTGPIQWDEQALQQTRERMPGRILLDAVLMMHPMGGALRALRSPLLRDLRLERMFRR